MYILTLLLLLLLLSLSPLYRVFTRMSPRQTVSLGEIPCCSYSFVLLSVRCTVRICLVPTLVLMVFYVSASRRMCAVPNMAVLCLLLLLFSLYVYLFPPLPSFLIFSAQLTVAYYAPGFTQIKMSWFHQTRNSVGPSAWRIGPSDMTAVTYTEQPYKQSRRNSFFTIPVALEGEVTWTARLDPGYPDQTILGQL